MSKYTVLLEVSKQLKKVLDISFQQASLTSPEKIDAQIVFTNPKETRDSTEKTPEMLSLWLYRVAEDEFQKNQPMERTAINRTNGADNDRTRTDRVAPLALDLFYLLTPMSSLNNPNTGIDKDLIMLGRAMQALYDNAIMPLQTPVENVSEEMHIVLCRLTLEELTRVWEALQEPYRLSVCYQVRVMRIDSERYQTRGRIAERRGRYAEPSAVEE